MFGLLRKCCLFAALLAAGGEAPEPAVGKSGLRGAGPHLAAAVSPILLAHGESPRALPGACGDIQPVVIDQGPAFSVIVPVRGGASNPARRQASARAGSPPSCRAPPGFSGGTALPAPCLPDRSPSAV